MPAIANDRFLRVLAGRSVDRIPVWFMRQAGRYLPQYRGTRSGASFLEMCRTPALAAEVTVQPIDVLDFDAAILFSDILVPLEAMGLEVTFDEGAGPRIVDPIRTADDLPRLRRGDPAREVGYVGGAVEAAKSRLGGRVPLIGFAGAPWTVASYIVEGKTSKSFRHAAGWLHADPTSFARLLDVITDVTIDYLEMQVAAGVDALQLFDSWGGWLARDVWAELCAPRIARIAAHFTPRRPVILYVNGSTQHLTAMAATGATALGVDWRLPLDAVRASVGAARPLQGNLDPTALYADPARLTSMTRAVLESGRGGSHVFNLGHGILPDAPVDAVRTVIETVRHWNPTSA